MTTKTNPLFLTSPFQSDPATRMFVNHNDHQN
jgi:hypothetical protein